MNPGPEPDRPTFKPRALLFTTLAALWFFPSLGAIVILRRTPRPVLPEVATLPERLRAVPLERWCAIGLVVLQLLFIGLALYHHFYEIPRPVPDPPSEPRDRDDGQPRP